MRRRAAPLRHTEQPQLAILAALDDQAIAEQNRTCDDTRITVREVRIHVVPSAGIAWATSLWDFTTTNGGREMHLPVRCSWVLEKRRGTWVIVHFHKSVAA